MRKAAPPAARVELMFRAFSDPTRLRILGLLRGGERCVCELVDILRCPQPKASRHLAYLRKAGLVMPAIGARTTGASSAMGPMRSVRSGARAVVTSPLSQTPPGRAVRGADNRAFARSGCISLNT